MRFHFHVDDNVPNNDREGTDLQSIEDAKTEACYLVGALLVDQCTGFWQSPSWRLRVTDEAGAQVLSITVSGFIGPAMES